VSSSPIPERTGAVLRGTVPKPSVVAHLMRHGPPATIVVAQTVCVTARVSSDGLPIARNQQVANTAQSAALRNDANNEVGAIFFTQGLNRPVPCETL
jgi:hypothetical protein